MPGRGGHACTDSDLVPTHPTIVASADHTEPGTNADVSPCRYVLACTNNHYTCAHPANVAVRADNDVQVLVLIPESRHPDVDATVRCGQHAELGTSLCYLQTVRVWVNGYKLLRTMHAGNT